MRAILIGLILTISASVFANPYGTVAHCFIDEAPYNLRIEAKYAHMDEDETIWGSISVYDRDNNEAMIFTHYYQLAYQSFEIYDGIIADSWYYVDQAAQEQSSIHIISIGTLEGQAVVNLNFESMGLFSGTFPCTLRN